MLASLSLVPVDMIPPKRHASRTPRDPYFKPAHKTRTRTYNNLISDFLASDWTHARVRYNTDEYDTTIVRSGLNAALRVYGRVGVRVLTRGDTLYLTRDSAELRPDASAILNAFLASGAATRTLHAPEGTDLDALYAALQYRRTRDGLGYVRVGRDKATGRIVLTDLTAQNGSN